MYSDNLRWDYYVQAPVDTLVLFQCSYFRLQLRNWTGHCLDYLQVPEDATAGRFRHFCGIDFPRATFRLTEHKDNNKLVFVSDGTVRENGFQCLLKKLPEERSGQSAKKSFLVNLMTKSVNSFLSPFPEYKSRTQMTSNTFQIATPPNTKAIMSCSKFSIPDNWKCLEEYLVVNGERYCGTNVPNQLLLYIPNGRLDFTYVGNAASTNRFECTVTRVSSDTLRCMAPPVNMRIQNRKTVVKREAAVECLDLTTTSVATIESEYFGFGNYSENQEKKYYVMAPLASTITMDCTNFNLELSRWCKKDYLAVDSDLWALVRYCGKTYKGRNTIEDKNVIRFVSDNNVTDSGYRCTFKKHTNKIDYEINLLIRESTWIAYDEAANPMRWFNSKKRVTYLITAPEGSMINMTCTDFNVRCLNEDLHIGSRLYGESLCDGNPKRTILVNYNLANNTISLTDDLRSSTKFNCTISRSGEYGNEPCSFSKTT